MKLTGRTYLIIGVLIFIIAVAVLYLNYSKQVSQQKTAQSNVTSAQANLNSLLIKKNAQATLLTQTQDQVAQLQYQLNTIQQNLTQTIQNLPLAVDNTSYQETLFQTAAQYNVSLVSVTAGDAGSKTVGNLTFTTTTFQLTLKGKIDNILNMLHALASESPYQFTTIDQLGMNTIVENITVTGPDGKPVQTTVTSETMTVSLIVYGYGG